MLQVVYEGVSSMCFSCGQLGHRRMDCRYTPQPPLISPESQKVAEEGVLFGNGTREDKTGDVAYGPWTFVTHKKHGLKPKRLETKVFPNGTTSTGQLKLDQEKLNLVDLQLDSPKVLDNHASNRPDYSYRTPSQGSEPTGGMSTSHENSPNTFGIDDSTDLSAPTRHDSKVQYMPRKRISKKAPGSRTGLKGVLSGVSKGKNMKKDDVLLARDFSMSKTFKKLNLSLISSEDELNGEGKDMCVESTKPMLHPSHIQANQSLGKYPYRENNIPNTSILKSYLNWSQWQGESGSGSGSRK